MRCNFEVKKCVLQERPPEAVGHLRPEGSVPEDVLHLHPPVWQQRGPAGRTVQEKHCVRCSRQGVRGRVVCFTLGACCCRLFWMFGYPHWMLSLFLKRQVKYVLFLLSFIYTSCSSSLCSFASRSVAASHHSVWGRFSVCLFVRICSENHSFLFFFLLLSQMSPRCASLALKHYLLKPVQRIPQYQLLLTGAETVTPPCRGAWLDKPQGFIESFIDWGSGWSLLGLRSGFGTTLAPHGWRQKPVWHDPAELINTTQNTFLFIEKEECELFISSTVVVIQ